MKLPEAFIARMRDICPDYDDFVACCELPPECGIRINTLKLPLDRAGELGYTLEPVPFSPLSFRVIGEQPKHGASPWHHAGAYYAQEPSASSAVTALDPQPGERVLDMCAAPGGKSTQIAALMRNRGLLWSNEYVRSRAQALISNLERTGVRIAAVSSLHPDRIAEELPEFFDRVLVDAPCSGEGMFRKDAQAIADWSPEHVSACAERQLAILRSASRCLRPGGVMVYSTCTFSPEENEGVVSRFLADNDEFELEEIPVQFGRSALDVCGSMTFARRIYPMDGGEGHFVARMRRRGDGGSEPASESQRGSAQSVHSPKNDLVSMAAELLDDCFTSECSGTLRAVGEDVYLLPDLLPERCPQIIRAGVYVGRAAKGRIEPEHALFMSARPDELRRVIVLPADSDEILSFLHGNEIPADPAIKGYTAVACSGVIVGFGKCSGGRLKNRYPKGLRMV